MISHLNPVLVTHLSYLGQEVLCIITNSNGGVRGSHNVLNGIPNTKPSRPPNKCMRQFLHYYIGKDYIIHWRET